MWSMIFNSERTLLIPLISRNRSTDPHSCLFFFSFFFHCDVFHTYTFVLSNGSVPGSPSLDQKTQILSLALSNARLLPISLTTALRYC
jgi:hypothetical protein